jgi:hypothetical protein
MRTTIFIILIVFVIWLMVSCYLWTEREREKIEPQNELKRFMTIRCDGFNNDKERAEYDRLLAYHGAQAVMVEEDGKQYFLRDGKWFRFVWPERKS